MPPGRRGRSLGLGCFAASRRSKRRMLQGASLRVACAFYTGALRSKLQVAAGPFAMSHPVLRLDPVPHRLSKSRYTAGVQCHKLLWWKVHEPNAVELQPDKVLQDRFDQGAQVGALARDRFPGGILVDLPYYAADERVTLTRKLIADGAPAIFEASALADNTFVAVDVLTPQNGGAGGGGFHLTEVKSSSSQKEEHLQDVAVQIHVLERSGIHITGADVMHLNKECRFPDLTNLFERTDVTELVRPLINKVSWEIDKQSEMLDGPLPDIPIGLQCHEPYECPFMERCWPKDPDHRSEEHTSELQSLRHLV